ncbi:cytochrome P450 oxidoreductase [Acrodontium crateriforme]|uniref:Cytochrome P450 oxidoreductase n=1 Tax=Acrodontium crateriforme TaxID=150365 RepID=A0AAQ3MBZ6_9PEZI|nr:cytochrome P450 oxidoreductase [Acrodontium crateriforme]
MAFARLIELVVPTSATDTYSIITSVTLGLTGLLAYRVFLSPLRQIPGPFICRMTSLWMYYHSYIGDDCSLIDELHKKYGPVVVISPREVSISDRTALMPIYSDKGGFIKAPCYSNFDIEGHKTIFSTRDPAHRAVRSKAVLPMFSMANIRAGSGAIETSANKLVAKLREEALRSRKTCRSVNVLNLARSLAIDAACAYLFGKSYGGIDEDVESMTANAFVDALVAVGRLFFMPTWFFLLIEETRLKYFLTKEEVDSTESVHGFADQVVRESEKSDLTYQGRLLKAGISLEETEVQCKDLIFAGTDSTGNNFATLCWFLAKYPDIHKRLRDEIAEAEANDPNYLITTLRYLDAVVREGLRLSMANPTRFPREVPPQGWNFTAFNGQQFHFPAKTVVGVQPFTLHLNPEVFPEPLLFKPERWLDATPEMQRDWIPFGQGARQCIARNLATAELLYATRAVVRDGVLEGAKPAKDEIERIQWFNSRVVGDKIELIWA